MDITISQDRDAFIVTVGEKSILTTDTDSQEIATKWIREVQRVYRRKGRNFLVGLCADRQLNYTNRGLENNPFELLQLCIGSHCLLFQLPDSGYCVGRYDDPRFRRYCCDRAPKSIRNFLSDSRTTVVGVGIERDVEKLKKERQVHVEKPVELRDLAERCLQRSDLGRCSLEKLAKVVLGEEMDIVKPSRMDWWARSDRWGLSDDKLKFATVEAFLAYEIGVKLLGDRQH